MHALVIGEFNRSERAGLETAGERAGARLDFFSSPDHAIQALAGSGPTPHGIIAAHSAELDTLVRWVRDQAALFAVPILALVPHPTDRWFQQAYGCGANDALVMGDAGGLTRRLANLREHKPRQRPPAARGAAIIASPDLPERRLIGRTLRQAGFDVGFAARTDELLELSRAGDPPALVVATHNFPPDGPDAAIESLRELIERPELPAVVLPPNPREGDGPRTIGEVDPACRLLFMADESLAGEAREQRASRRLLFATICAFRRASDLEPIYGFTHNISREGLYVRTLDPPPSDADLRFEMRTPEVQEAVHLRGLVVWRRDVGSLGSAQPPGFGMRIDADACAARDLKEYRRAYDSLCEDTE